MPDVRTTSYGAVVRGGTVADRGDRAASVSAGRHVSLPHDAIHSVTNPLDRVTAGLHVYGGDLTGLPRSMWETETLVEVPLSHARDFCALDAYNATLDGAGI